MSNPAGPADPDKLAPPPIGELVIGKDLAHFVRVLSRPFDVIRLHGLNPTTQKPYPPVYFSTAAGSRWDHSLGPGTLCLGLKMDGALFEVFGGAWPSVFVKDDPLRRRFLSWEAQQSCFRTYLTLPPGLRLLDLGRPGLLNLLGTDSLLLSSRRYEHTREWGRWLGACLDIDGLLYSSRPGGASLTNVVLFKRIGLQAVLERTETGTKSLSELGAPFRRVLQKYQVISGPKPVIPKS